MLSPILIEKVKNLAQEVKNNILHIFFVQPKQQTLLKTLLY
jgi:hypothetical protein